MYIPREMSQTEKLPFGESHWDYLPDLVQNYIQDLAARSLHRQRMKRVCRSIKLYGKWRSRIVLDFEVMFYFYRKKVTKESDESDDKYTIIIEKNA